MNKTLKNNIANGVTIFTIGLFPFVMFWAAKLVF